MDAARGDVVRSANPFKLGTERQRPWLIVNTDAHPFDDEHIAVAISTRSYDPSLRLVDDHSVTGGVPVESFVSLWAIHSPRTVDLVAWQGRVTDAFVDEVVDGVESYPRDE